MLRASTVRPVTYAVAPALGVLGVAGLDLLAGARRWPIPVAGLLDEPAHLLTAGLALAALARARTDIWPWALLGAVAIDIDHIPLYLWGGPVADEGGRPVTHSLATVLALLIVAGAIPKFRTPAGGLAAGIVFHLLRDIATGPGVPLLWPLRPDSVRTAHWSYLLALVALAAIATTRQRRSHLRTTRRR